jgi:muramoyltetrapeptide carboxypeptidase
MERKHFLLGIGSTLAGLTVLANNNSNKTQIAPEAKRRKIPAYLKQGDTIGVTCPAGNLSVEDFLIAKTEMEAWGFKVIMGNTVGTKWNSFADTDELRAKDFQAMLDNPQVKAIMCGRGGYGVTRIIDNLDFKAFKKNPKWIIGFSDITALHTHINSRYSIATIHAKMCNSFIKDKLAAEPIQLETIDSTRRLLIGEKMSYSCAAHPLNKLGECTGPIVGGNLSLIETCSGTPSQLNTKGKILFLEEVSEFPYSIDRMMWNVKRSGLLDNCRGLIVGGFRTKKEDPGQEFGITVQDIILKVCEPYNFPIAFDFPVGHQKANYAIKCNALHQLTVASSGTVLQELR